MVTPKHTGIRPVRVDEPYQDVADGKWVVVWYDADGRRYAEASPICLQAHAVYALKAEHMAGRLLGVVS